MNKNDRSVQVALDGVAAATAWNIAAVITGSGRMTLQDSLYVGGGAIAGSVLGGDAANDQDRYKRTAMIGAGAAAGAYLSGKTSYSELGIGAAAGVVGHAAVQTALFYPISTIGPILL
jgi:hypothetical protein